MSGDRRKFDATKAMTMEGKSATYTRFAESNRLNTVNFGASYPQVNYSYDAQLRMTSKGMWTRTFNPKDEVTQIAPAAGSGVGNLNWYHRYDSTGQLSQGIFGVMGPSGPAGTTYNYSYDQIGNHQLSGVTYNTVNQPSNLTYDANGNMTAKDGKQYVYDGENRLVRILENFYDAWEQGIEFHYDYAGRCYQRNDVFIDATDSANSYNTPYEYIIYDGAKQIMTLDGDKSVTGEYVWQPESSGDADVILWDQGGVYSTDCNKNVVAYNIIPEWPDQPSATYYDYTPFGVPVGNAGSAKRFMFSSEEWFPARSTLNYGLILYLYRAYSPALARFLTRDPINEQGGVNLYNFVHNNPVTRWDDLGMWDSLIHQRQTAIWAENNRYPRMVAQEIAEANEAVDGGAIGSGLGWAPWGTQGYHFNRNKAGEDSRLQYSKRHVEEAKFWCDESHNGQEYWDSNGNIHDFKTNPKIAAQELGIALHPLQDWVAHGDYGIYDNDNIYAHHNQYSPQENLLGFGKKEDFPDNPVLDAIRGPNGRPADLAMHTVLTNMGMSVRLYALYEPGTKRLSLTKKLSVELLTEYLSWLAINGTCECKRYFGLIQ